MKRILFPTDFSETSKNAFIYAMHLAHSLKAELIVLHVYDLPNLNVGRMANTMKEVYDSIELENFDNLKDQIPLLRNIAAENGFEDLSISTILKKGDLVWAIKDTVKTENIDFLVMGTKGATGLKEVFLGSNTGAVVTDTNVATFGIPESSKFRPIKNIVFTTRFRMKDIKALKKVKDIAANLGANIHCLYVKTSKSDVKDVVLQDWKLLFEKDNIAFHIIENNNIQKSILDFSTSHDVDMLAMLNHKRGFFEELFKQSMAQQLAYHTQVPLLAIPEHDL
uniref:universal stress protein n=2 Tax=Flavobacterium sp. TaxID=239 RepID=UPI00404AE1D0